MDCALGVAWRSVAYDTMVGWLVCVSLFVWLLLLLLLLLLHGLTKRPAAGLWLWVWLWVWLCVWVWVWLLGQTTARAMVRPVRAFTKYARIHQSVDCRPTNQPTNLPTNQPTKQTNKQTNTNEHARTVGADILPWWLLPWPAGVSTDCVSPVAFAAAPGPIICGIDDDDAANVSAPTEAGGGGNNEAADEEEEDGG